VNAIERKSYFTEAKEPTFCFTSERHRAKELFYTGAKKPTIFFTSERHRAKDLFYTGANDSTKFLQGNAIERKSYFTQKPMNQRNFTRKRQRAKNKYILHRSQ
jgi:hypothetical protein